MAAAAENVQVQISVAEICSALEHDPDFFINFFLADELTVPVPEFHPTIFYEMVAENIDRYACAIPRAHAKTTLAKLACVWHFLFSPYSFIIYVSNTHDIAVPSTNDIVAFMESENFKSVFGALEWHIKRDGEGIYKFRIVSLNKTCILRAHGAGKQVRGINIEHRRPQLAIVDDLEDNDNIATEALFTKLKRWFYGPFQKALDPRGNKIIHLGNMLQQMSLLWNHVKSDRWHSRLYGAILSNGEALWPDLWSIEALRRDFADYQEQGLTDVWFAEMMNMPMVPGGGIIQAQEITYGAHKTPDECQYGFITIDLAISEETWSHQTVAAAHAWIDDDNRWQVVEYRAWKGIDPIDLFDNVCQMMEHWRFFVCGIESVAFQAALAPIYEYMAKQKGWDYMQFIALTIGNQKKARRIIPFAAALKTKPEQPALYALTSGEFSATQQLLNYNPVKRENDDDIIDCMALGLLMIRMYMQLIVNQQRGYLMNAGYQSTYQISPV